MKLKHNVAWPLLVVTAYVLVDALTVIHRRRQGKRCFSCKLCKAWLGRKKPPDCCTRRCRAAYLRLTANKETNADRQDFNSCEP